jgi:hypothetical protein
MLIFGLFVTNNRVRKQANIISQLEEQVRTLLSNQSESNDYSSTTPSDTIALPLEGTHIPSL